MGCSLPRTSIGLKGMLLVCLLGILSTAVFGEDHPYGVYSSPEDIDQLETR